MEKTFHRLQSQALLWQLKADTPYMVVEPLVSVKAYHYYKSDHDCEKALWGIMTSRSRKSASFVEQSRAVRLLDFIKSPENCISALEALGYTYREPTKDEALLVEDGAYYVDDTICRLTDVYFDLSWGQVLFHFVPLGGGVGFNLKHGEVQNGIDSGTITSAPGVEGVCLEGKVLRLSRGSLDSFMSDISQNPVSSAWF